MKNFNLSEYVGNDEFVKSVFDQVRNMGLVSLVAATAAWTYRQATPDWRGIDDYAMTIVLALLASALFSLAEQNVRQRLVRAGASTWLGVILVALYATILAQIVRYALRA